MADGTVILGRSTCHHGIGWDSRCVPCLAEWERLCINDARASIARHERRLVELEAELATTDKLVQADGEPSAAARRFTGHCAAGDQCVCGGDTPAVRATCSNWRTQPP